MIYEYKCTSCENIWDKWRSIKDRNKKTRCPLCKEEGKLAVSGFDWYFHRTHPDVKQDMGELVAGIPASNFTEI